MVAVRVSPSEKRAILGTVKASGQGNVSRYLRQLLGLPLSGPLSRDREAH